MSKLQEAIDPYISLDGGTIERVMARTDNGVTYTVLVIHKGNSFYEIQFRSEEGQAFKPIVRHLK